ncbi:MAG: hypothetical protein MEQ74_11960 [Paracoccus sp.]|nr:hypothetical protein [Paracoccus sp. (in: a-proteobacteria)]
MTAEYEAMRGLFISVIHAAFLDARKDVLEARRKLHNEVSRAKDNKREAIREHYQQRLDQTIAAHRRYFESRDYREVCMCADLHIRADNMMRAVEAPEVRS